MGNAVFQSLSGLKPFDGFSKNLAHLIMTSTPPHEQMLGSVSSKGACLRMREVIAVRRLFLFTFRSHSFRYRSACWTEYTPLMAQTNDASWWHLHFLYGLDNEHSYFPIFKQKSEKLHNAQCQL